MERSEKRNPDQWIEDVINSTGAYDKFRLLDNIMQDTIRNSIRELNKGHNIEIDSQFISSVRHLIENYDTNANIIQPAGRLSRKASSGE